MLGAVIVGALLGMARGAMNAVFFGIQGMLVGGGGGYLATRFGRSDPERFRSIGQRFWLGVGVRLAFTTANLVAASAVHAGPIDQGDDYRGMPGRDHRQRHTRRDTIRFRKQEHTLQIKTLDTAELHRLARLGAIVRLHELAQEAAALRKMFPNLKNATETVAEPAPSATKPPKLKSRVVTEAARKSQSEKMKAYWAKKKGEGAAPQPVAEVAEQVQAAKATPKKVARKTRKPKAAKRAK